MQLILDTDPPYLIRYEQRTAGVRMVEFFQQNDTGSLTCTIRLVLGERVTPSDYLALGQALFAVLSS